jgi:hypothetical protein
MLSITGHQGNASQTLKQRLSSSTRMAVAKRQRRSSIGNASQCNHSGKKFGDFLKI